jgi:hypothetical protein
MLIGVLLERGVKASVARRAGPPPADPRRLLWGGGAGSCTGCTVTATCRVWLAPPWITPRMGDTSP